jgi:uncharacterized protein (DUF488 family)
VTNPLVTIGYEGKSIDELVELLHAHDVEVLVDVRLNAMSRKPGFSKKRLAGALAAAGIDYVHEPDLGNPQDNRSGFHAGDPASRERYLDVMRSDGADALARTASLARERAVALFCYEADPAICHRRCVADELGLHVIDV